MPPSGTGHGVQRVPHVAGSVLETQTPWHGCSPLAHAGMQAPLKHCSPLAQAWPHAPQLSASFWRSTQSVPHWVNPSGQVMVCVPGPRQARSSSHPTSRAAPLTAYAAEKRNELTWLPSDQS
jgi:hypothetical protein